MTDDHTPTDTAPAAAPEPTSAAPETATENPPSTAAPDVVTDTGQDDANGDDTERDGRIRKANREAARYRTQLRDTQTERDQVRGQLTAIQRAEVLRVAGLQLQRGEDLFAFTGTDDVSAYLAEDGTVDAEKVKAAAAEVLAERGYLRRPPSRGSGEFPGSPYLAHTPEPRMGDIFRAP
ncbi:hypothetical protein [Actinomadura macra]|uniref:hypothetical protein n=1 Tax=Actinomadura macra TaxID=46164 RepID=UPI0008322075|nr:hypothetical protein [Actinomadura macra]